MDGAKHQPQAEPSRRYRDGVAKRLTKIEAAIETLNATVAVLLVERSLVVDRIPEVEEQSS